ncbi:MAG: hypothetical protein DI568_01150 [Sphingomonas sp.]|nr:MAG: hypothetical protein DI568_01150 [Sphingomonas sp.]
MTSSATARIDHLLTYVPDLEAAADLFQRMGFHLSPLSRIEQMGVANRMALMRPQSPGQASYIELMSPYEPARLPPPLQPVLSGGPGIGSMVLVADDVSGFRTSVLAQGFECAPPAHVTREWKIPGEPSVFPEFDVMLPVEAPLRFNACKYYNLHLYLREDWTAHPNGAIRLLKVLAVADDPADLDFFASLFGQPGVVQADGSLLLPSGEIALEIIPADGLKSRFGIEPDGRAPGYLGYEIEVESLQKLRTQLQAGGVPFQDGDGLISITPDTGLGNLILFSEAA